MAAATAALGAALLAAAAAAALAVAAVLAPRELRLPLLAAALALAGWAWSSARLDALDRSGLVAEAGESGRARAVVTGPARRGAFALRVPARLTRFGRRAVDEPVLLELPLSRPPAQGSILDLIAKIELPRPAEDGFDERAWLRRRGVHVVVSGTSWRVVGRRGGAAGLADRLRARLGRTIAPGLTRERRAVVAGIVLGEDEGLSPELRDAFRASGLYHLLCQLQVSVQAGPPRRAAEATSRPRGLPLCVLQGTHRKAIDRPRGLGSTGKEAGRRQRRVSRLVVQTATAPAGGCPRTSLKTVW